MIGQHSIREVHVADDPGIPVGRQWSGPDGLQAVTANDLETPSSPFERRDVVVALAEHDIGGQVRIPDHAGVVVQPVLDTLHLRERNGVVARDVLDVLAEVLAPVVEREQGVEIQ